MKVHKKIFYVLIILIILSQIFSPQVFATESSNTKYLALGDSIAYGYGLKNRTSQCYAQLVRIGISVSENNFSNLAISGMTCAEFKEIIKKDKYTNAIKSSDIITISIGSNELLKTAITGLSDATNVTAETDEEILNLATTHFINATNVEKAIILYYLN